MKLGFSSDESILSHRNGCDMIEMSLLLLLDGSEFGSFPILGASPRDPLSIEEIKKKTKKGGRKKEDNSLRLFYLIFIFILIK